MTNNEAKLQIALVASNVLKVIGINNSDFDLEPWQRLRLAENDIETALLIAEKLVDLANPVSAGLENLEVDE